MNKLKQRGIHFKVIFAWYDMWVGVYIDRKTPAIYIFPIPMIGLRIMLPPKVESFISPTWEEVQEAKQRNERESSSVRSKIMNAARGYEAEQMLADLCDVKSAYIQKLEAYMSDKEAQTAESETKAKSPVYSWDNPKASVHQLPRKVENGYVDERGMFVFVGDGTKESPTSDTASS